MSPRTRSEADKARAITRDMWQVSVTQAYLWAKGRCDAVGDNPDLVFQHLAAATAAVDELADLFVANLDVLWAAHQPWMTRTYLRGAK